MNQTLYIMQGPSGSGKSSLANVICNDIENAVVCSTDDFFCVGNHYKFCPDKLGEYHKLNERRAIKAMNDGMTVIVDNTNIRAWNCRGYVRHAVERGIPVVFVRVNGNFQGIHKVPEHVIQEMRESMEDLTIEKVLASKCPWENVVKK